MSHPNLYPYLFFKGTCREALQFYQGIFGGTLEVNSYDDLPEMSNESNKGWLMHGQLNSNNIVIMASDTEQASPVAKKVSLSINGDNEEQLREMFAKLSEGGEVISELQKEFWGDIFGVTVDKFGVEWMIAIAAPQA